jgi:hypothetical protein
MEERTTIPVYVPSKLAERTAALGLLALIGLPLASTWSPTVRFASIVAVASISAAATAISWWRRRSREATVSVDETHVHLVDAAGRTRSWPRSTLAHAEIAHKKGGGTLLRVLDRTHAVLFSLELPGSAEVETWIARLGLDRRARELAVHERLVSVGQTETRVFATLFTALTLIGAFSGGSVGANVWLLPLAVFAATRGPLLVGVDGVEERRLPRRRFHPMSEIADVEKSDSKIHLVMRDGRRVRLGVSTKSTDGALRDDIEWTIRRALTAYARRERAASLEHLARGQRDVREWLAELEKLAGVGDYRRGALTAERLAEAVHDPDAEPSVRAAAAWILARSGKLDAAREARANAAHPKVRVALDAVMAEDVEALDRATREGREATV